MVPNNNILPTELFRSLVNVSQGDLAPLFRSRGATLYHASKKDDGFMGKFVNFDLRRQ